jgi:hypothetical protein
MAYLQVEFASNAEEDVMADDQSDRGPQDRLRINMDEDDEVAYWTKELRITDVHLKALVKRYGVMVADVRGALGR